MYINIHLEKEEISKALKEYVERNGYKVKKDDGISVILQVNKGNAREEESWHATICGCEQISKGEEDA